MSAQLVDGKKIAEILRSKVQQSVLQRIARGKRRPGLAVIIVGQNPASLVYVKNKRMACEQVGFHSLHIDLPDTVTEQELLTQIEQLNQDPTIDGILVQLPLPAQIDANHVTDAIRPDK